MGDACLDFFLLLGGAQYAAGARVRWAVWAMRRGGDACGFGEDFAAGAEARINHVDGYQLIKCGLIGGAAS